MSALPQGPLRHPCVPHTLILLGTTPESLSPHHIRPPTADSIMAWWSRDRLAISQRLYRTRQVAAHLRHTLQALQHQVYEDRERRESMRLRLRELEGLKRLKDSSNTITRSVDMVMQGQDSFGWVTRLQMAALSDHGPGGGPGRPHHYSMDKTISTYETINGAYLGGDYLYRIYVEAGRLLASRERVASLLMDHRGRIGPDAVIGDSKT
ncbi:hypothetical protein C7212DRAFT_346750 [Tuber magnatum]|uniref:Uncharacterized protein n=1 Tax=Tuber magnatum TaxID=42249 RepID=A0A317SJQ3_9PEZI|nr:hypothetical protein C7212DRAFT_346750 [Tuber magnatum]